MKVEKIFNDYFSYICITKSKNQASLKTEVNDCNTVYKALHSCGIKYIRQLDNALYLKLLDYYLKNTKRKNSTIEKQIKKLSSILKYHGIKTNITCKRLADDTRPFESMSEYELVDVLNYADSLDLTYKNNFTYKLALFLLLDTGIRVHELLKIKISDINFYRREIFIIGKGTKIRYVPFTFFTEKLLREAVKRNQGKTDYLLWNYWKNKHIDMSGTRWFFKEIEKATGIKIYHHMLRKTMATLLFENGADKKTVQTILGHSKSSTTDIYLMSCRRRMHNDYEKYATWHNMLSNNY